MKQRILNLKPSVFIALGLAIIVGVWLWSGQIETDEVSENMDATGAVETTETTDETAGLVKVRTIQSVAKDHQAVIIVSGQTEEDKLVTISAETDGRFTTINMEKGQAVVKGQIIAKMAIDDRQASVNKAKALVEQRTLQYDAASKLADKGYQSQTRKKTAAADLSAAKAELTAAQVDLNNTVIVAPFDGVVKTKQADIGGYAQRGDPIAEVVSLNPIYVTGQVAEKEIRYIAMGTKTNVRLITGHSYVGEITRIAPVADDTTRTFKIEAKVDNSLGEIPVGLTAELRLPLDTVSAHLITPALLSLNDEGDVGVKTVDKNGIVIFNKILIIEDTQEGIWVAGMPKEATIISVGQEYVIHGQEVETITDQRQFSNASSGDAS